MTKRWVTEKANQSQTCKENAAMKKRQMILIPQVNPSSFVFFYEMGNSGSSWSIRDYSNSTLGEEVRSNRFLFERR